MQYSVLFNIKFSDYDQGSRRPAMTISDIYLNPQSMPFSDLIK